MHTCARPSRPPRSHSSVTGRWRYESAQPLAQAHSAERAPDRAVGARRAGCDPRTIRRDGRQSPPRPDARTIRRKRRQSDTRPDARSHGDQRPESRARSHPQSAGPAIEPCHNWSARSAACRYAAAARSTTDTSARDAWLADSGTRSGSGSTGRRTPNASRSGTSARPPEQPLVACIHAMGPTPSSYGGFVVIHEGAGGVKGRVRVVSLLGAVMAGHDRFSR